jgi:uncharacterized protein YdbL (DUF1318 family)
MKRVGRIGLFCLVMLAACVTVNIYFPAAEVQKAADKIVDDVTAPEEKAPPKPGSSGWLLKQLRVVRNVSLGPECAHAEVNLNVSTPAIRALKEALRNDFHQLRPYYEKTVVGESKNGFVEIRDSSRLDLREQAQVKQLVDQINKDRTSLYREIQTANKYPSEILPQIQKIFANSWREKSHAGWWIQNDSGEWIKK